MLDILRTILLGAALAWLPPSAALAPPAAAKEQPDKHALQAFLALIPEIHVLYSESIDFLMTANALDTAISNLGEQGAQDEEAITHELAAFTKRAEATFAERPERIAKVRKQVNDAPIGERRKLLLSSLQTVESLDVALKDEVTYLHALLKAQQEGDSDAFNQLSQQSLIRHAALLRTENAMLQLLIGTVDAGHPTAFLQKSIMASNEGLALMSEMGARFFGSEPTDPEETSRKIHAQAEIMRDAIAGGREARERILAEMSLRAKFSARIRALRDTIDLYGKSFDVEAEMADHIETLGDVVREFHSGVTADIAALDARTLALSERRVTQKAKITEALEVYADKF